MAPIHRHCQNDQAVVRPYRYHSQEFLLEIKERKLKKLLVII